MDEKKKSPSQIDKNPEIKTLGKWVSTQKQNYKNNKWAVWTNPDIRAAWETTLEKYAEYLINDDDAILDSIDLLEMIARGKNLPLNKGLLDTRKVATMLINDYRNSLLGRISLESPKSRDLMMKESK